MIGQHVPASLFREGRAMLAAVLEDLCRCPGVSVVTRLDPVLWRGWPCPENLTVHTARPGTEADDVCSLARGRLHAADCTGVPGHSWHACQWVEEAGGRLLGPSWHDVGLAADKYRLAEHLWRRGVPTPPTNLWAWEAVRLGFPLVVKPRDGRGPRPPSSSTTSTSTWSAPVGLLRKATRGS